MIAQWASALLVTAPVAVLGWWYASRQHNVNVVDSLWSLFFLAAGLWWASTSSLALPQWLLLAALSLWSLRLSLHLTVRNYGKPEDHRYAAMRARHDNFNRRSLLTVFGLQLLLSLIIAMPLAVALLRPATLSPWHGVAALLYLIGFTFEALSDWQLSRFRADPANRGKVLDNGLWQYSRHPNYFGEACVWWSFYFCAVAAGGWWSLFSPLLMTVLLLRVSGVSLLEKDIADRRPGYQDYIRRVPAFFPRIANPFAAAGESGAAS